VTFSNEAMVFTRQATTRISGTTFLFCYCSSGVAYGIFFIFLAQAKEEKACLCVGGGGKAKGGHWGKTLKELFLILMARA